jgi:hypothetical protein
LKFEIHGRIFSLIPCLIVVTEGKMTPTIMGRATSCHLLLLVFWWSVHSLCCCQAQEDDTITTSAGTILRSVVVEAADPTVDDASNDASYYHHQAVPDDCTMVMAQSSIPNAGWGVYTLTERKQNEPLLSWPHPNKAAYGDVVMQIPDLQHASGAKKLLWEYLWDAFETGGQCEGLKVVSFVPGVGMLANGHVTQFNVLPSLQPMVDHAGGERRSSPGAGAFTYYHNFTWFVSGDMAPGDEILVNYGPTWFQERGLDSSVPLPPKPSRPSLFQLRQDGYCLDNLRPGLSTITHAGRGAFANRRIPQGTIVSPVPVLPLHRSSLKMIKQHKSGRWDESQQLIENYCYAHANFSSLVLCPYSDMVHLINHAAPASTNHTTAPTANVRLQWSTSHGPQYFDRPLELLQETSTRLLLELIATRDIDEGEEVLLDYGSDWSNAWNKHVQEWQAFEEAEENFVPSYVLNQQALSVVRTMVEQKTNPYPDNIFTSCYHKVSEQVFHTSQLDPQGKAKPVVVEWIHSQGIYEPLNLRPCIILDRRSTNRDTYTVRLMNRPGTAEPDLIPEAVIVTQVPRRAIRFSDKLYTTDQHLPKAFRHSIGLDVFPREWMDLTTSLTCRNDSNGNS